MLGVESAAFVVLGPSGLNGLSQMRLTFPRPLCLILIVSKVGNVTSEA